jgi:hypothetical protein
MTMRRLVLVSPPTNPTAFVQLCHSTHPQPVTHWTLTNPRGGLLLDIPCGRASRHEICQCECDWVQNAPVIAGAGMRRGTDGAFNSHLELVNATSNSRILKGGEMLKTRTTLSLDPLCQPSLRGWRAGVGLSSIEPTLNRGSRVVGSLNPEAANAWLVTKLNSSSFSLASSGSAQEGLRRIIRGRGLEKLVPGLEHGLNGKNPESHRFNSGSCLYRLMM